MRTFLRLAAPVALPLLLSSEVAFAQPVPPPGTGGQAGGQPTRGADAEAPKPEAPKPEAPKPPAADAPLLPPEAPKTDAPKPEEPAKPAAGEGSLNRAVGAAESKAAESKAAESKAAESKAGDPKATGAASGDRAATPGDGTENDTRVFAEDWWASAKPSFEMHGYYRVRSEFFSHFALGRKDTFANTIWPQPADNDYFDTSGVRNSVILCGDNPLKPEPCENNVQAGANMRFRIAPELHISDNLRILAQVDLLDNLVLGSTPEGYVNQPGDSGGYEVRQSGGYAPIGAFSSTQWSPSAGQNSLSDSIAVKRVWGEYMTPIGQLRFGRMASHWGLGMLVNSGDGFDQDWGSTADRIMFVTGYKPWDIYLAGLWDFANEGATSAIIGERQRPSYDLTQSDDVGQWGFVLARRRNAELQKLELAQGNVVLNGGVYAVYRTQSLDGAAPLGAAPNQVTSTLVRRDAEAFIPDFWFQFLFNKFRFEAEAAIIWGSVGNTDVRGGTNFDNPDVAGDEEDGWNVRQFGFAAQSEFRAFEDKLRIQLGGGYATGDADVEGLSPPAEGFDAQLTQDRTFSTFRFHPDYRVDLILFRNLLQRVQGAYYFRPSVEYDFTRDQDGQRLGGGAAVIWSRAAQPVQTPGNSPDLGLELNFKIYYQAKDGSLNDKPDQMGGFFTQVEYGVMFPLGGFDYLPQEEQDLTDAGAAPDISTAQTVRWYLGIHY